MVIKADILCVHPLCYNNVADNSFACTEHWSDYFKFEQWTNWGSEENPPYALIFMLWLEVEKLKEHCKNCGQRKFDCL